MSNINTKEVAAGAFFVAAGAAFIVNGVMTLDLGNATEMGPGYFPTLLAGALCMLGLAIGLQGAWSGASPFGRVSWRGVVLIGFSPVVFGAVIQPLGLVPALALSTLLASLSSRAIRFHLALSISFGLTAFCILIFFFALRMPIALFGPVLMDGLR